MRKYCKAIVNIVVAVAILLFVIFLFPRLLAFFAPFVVGWIIAWMAGPPVIFLEKKLKIKRRAGSVFVIVAVIALIVLFLYLVGSILVREGRDMVRSFPELMQEMKTDFEQVGELLDRIYRTMPGSVQEWLDRVSAQMENGGGDLIDKLGSPTLTAVGNFAKYLPTLLIGVIMSLLSAYFFVADREQINAWCRRHMPQVIRERYQLIRHGMLRAVGGYLKAQLKIEIWIYLVVAIGLWILKVKYLWLIALGIALLDFLPFFGTGTVMVPWAIVKFLGRDYKMGIGLLIVWGVGQLLRQIIQPKIVGDSIGVPPLPTLFLLYVGYRFGGVLGMIVAVPVGLILFSLYDAGVFDTTVRSIRILVDGVNCFRRFSPKDFEEKK